MINIDQPISALHTKKSQHSSNSELSSEVVGNEAILYKKAASVAFSVALRTFYKYNVVKPGLSSLMLK